MTEETVSGNGAQFNCRDNAQFCAKATGTGAIKLKSLVCIFLVLIYNDYKFN